MYVTEYLGKYRKSTSTGSPVCLSK
jgi:hypothetical protein